MAGGALGGFGSVEATQAVFREAAASRSQRASRLWSASRSRQAWRLRRACRVLAGPARPSRRGRPREPVRQIAPTAPGRRRLGRWRDGWRGLPGDRAGHGIQTLFQHGDAGIQPVAVAVERVDGGGEPPRLVLALPGDRLDLLRLPRQIDGRDLVAPPADLRTGWPCTATTTAPTGADAPRSQPPQRAAVELVFLGQKAGQQAAGIFRRRRLPARWSRSLAITSLALPKACRIRAQTLTGNARANLNPGGPGGPNRVSSPGRKRFKTARHASPYAFAGIRRKPDDRPIQPHYRARGRRGHADALLAAKGAASGRRPVAAGACAGRRAPGAGASLAVVVGPDHQAVADEVKRDPARCGDLRSARAPRHRACGAGGPRRDCRAAPTICWSRSAIRR